MSNTIKTVYVIHHSHTDIGYTDLQERVLYVHADYIRSAVRLMRDPANQAFRWNCETYFCVERFLELADEAEKEEFFELVKTCRMGISANYLNFNDLLDSRVCADRLREMVALFRTHGIPVRTAMCADINGISMGQRDAMLDNGVEFLFTNIHCHHGMYPLYHNQTPYFWENKAGQRLLVWNGEHYNLGNALGIKPNHAATYMTNQYFGAQADFSDSVEILHHNLTDYLASCESQGYPYDFILSSVSGVFSDNAPPEPEILHTIDAYNAAHGEEGVRLVMVSLQELYAAIRDKVQDAPVYHGDLTDWWANGVGSTPYAVKHYKEAVRNYHLCERLEPALAEKYPALNRAAQDNLLLYAEHTWGHSATVSDPYETMVQNLDIRKTSYASKAHESAALMLTQIEKAKGDTLRYYAANGKIKVKNASKLAGLLPVEFYVESGSMKNAALTDAGGKAVPCQPSRHPRGLRISFVDTFAPGEEKTYAYRELPAAEETQNTRVAYVGAEKVRDIVNDYDPITYRLPYEFENRWFRLRYAPGEGIKSFTNKKTGKSLLRPDCVPFFTPIYEETALVNHSEFPEYEERRLLGRNIRGKHAKLHIGKLLSIRCTDRGPVFTTLEFLFDLPGTHHAAVTVKLYEAIPRVEYKLRLGKLNSGSIESVYLPMTLTTGQSGEQAWIKKGSEAFRPGIDQLPGTCMEYYMSDDGIVFTGADQSILIQNLDTALITMGELKHHPITLCDGAQANNARPAYSWIMNNTWETNFKLDLGGYGEFCYCLSLSDETDPEKAFADMQEQTVGALALMVE